LWGRLEDTLICSRRAAVYPSGEKINAKEVGIEKEGYKQFGAAAAFIADLADAEKLIRDRVAGTFNNLIRLFTLSAEFDSSLQPSTKIEYRRMLTKAEGEFGDIPIAALDNPHVRRDFLDWREKFRERPESARPTIATRLFQRYWHGRLIEGISPPISCVVLRASITPTAARLFRCWNTSQPLCLPDLSKCNG
jgi:hypothetical protein